MSIVTQDFLNGSPTRADVEALVGFDISVDTGRPPVVAIDEDPKLGNALFTHYKFPFQRKFKKDHSATLGRLIKNGTLLDTDTKALIVLYNGEDQSDPVTVYQANGAHRSYAHHKFGFTRTYDYRIHVVKDEISAGKIYSSYDAGAPRNAAAANLAANGHLIRTYNLKNTTVSLLLAASPWVMAGFDPAKYGKMSADKNLRNDWFDKNAQHGVMLQAFYVALQKRDISTGKVFYLQTRGQQVPALFCHILENGTIKQNASLSRLMDDLLQVADGTLEPDAGTGLWCMCQAINIKSAAPLRGQRMYAVIRSWELYYSGNILGSTPLMDPIKISNPVV